MLSRAVAAHCVRFGRIYVWISIASIVPCLFLIRSLGIDMQWTRSLPQSNPLVSSFNRISSIPGASAAVFITVEGAEKEQAIAAVAAAVRRVPSVLDVVTGPDRRFLRKYAFWLADSASAARFTGMVLSRNLREFLVESGIISAAPPPSLHALRTSAAASEALARCVHDSSAETLSASAGVLLYGDSLMYSLDRRMVLAQVISSLSEHNIDSLAAYARAIRTASMAAVAPYSGTKIHFTGSPFVALEEQEAFRTASAVFTAAAVVIIAVALMRSFRGFKVTVYPLFAVCIAILWTFALVRVLFGNLNTMTIILGPMLAGLGIDYVIHLVNDCVITGASGGTRRQALTRTVERVTPGIIAGGLTSAAAFFSLSVLEVSAVREFAVVIGAGIMITMVASVLLGPALIESAVADRPMPLDGQLSLPTAGRILQKWAAFVQRRRAGVMMLLAALSVCMAAGITRLSFEYNYLELEPKGIESIRMKNVIAQRFGYGADCVIAVVNGLDSLQKLRNAVASLPQVSHVESIVDFLPARDDKDIPVAFMQDIADIKVDSSDIDSIRTLVSKERAVLAALSDKYAEAAQPRFDALERSMTYENIPAIAGAANRLVRAALFMSAACAAARPPSMSEVTAGPGKRYVTDVPGEYLLYMYPSRNIWHKDQLLRFDRAIEAVCPAATGLPRISIAIGTYLVRQAWICGAILAVIILAMLAVLFGDIRYAIIAMAPLAVGMLCLLGLCGLLGIKIHVFNIVVFPIIIGIGIDDGVHIVLGYVSDGRRQTAVFGRIGRALWLTSLTTAIGFGSVALYAHPGLQSIGVLLTLGIGLCFLTSVTLIPAILFHAAPSAMAE